MTDGRSRPRLKYRCPNCSRDKDCLAFKRTDPDGWCTSCRKFRRPEVAAVNYQPPAVDGVPICSSAVELNLGCRRVILVQRIGDCLRITTGRRVKRVETDSFVIGGTVLLPIEKLSAILREISVVAADQDVD